jgi:RNA polymerase sigma-70 factor (ECF subfamily)
MPAPSAQRITRLLQAWSQRKDVALEELLSLGHQVLRQPARRYMVGESPGPALQTTTEACLPLVNSRKRNLKNSTHFFAVSTQLLPRFLVDSARIRGYQKRGGESCASGS